MKARAECAFVKELFADVNVCLGAAVPGIQEAGNDGGEVWQYGDGAELVVCQVLTGITVADEE